MRRNMGRRGNVGNVGGGGPLMTGHLQDIDLELELLKRKREMIEQQQQLLVMEQQFQSSRHSYDQMRYDEPIQHGSNRDFAQLYESGSKQRSQFGRKRQSENQWQYDSAPKRITPQKKKNPPQFNQYQSPSNSGSGNFRAQKPHQGQGSNQAPKFSPRAPPPLMQVKVPKQSIGQKIANQKAQPKAPQKGFYPSKVSKPKVPAAPNKLAALPVTERKSLVAAASASIAKEAARVLLPDSVPSQQVSGRLELALGAIMKRVRELINGQPQHAAVLRSIQLQRVMKQTVRERIRTVMLGKVVGSLNDILAIYREEFPEETDADILSIGLEAAGISAPEQKLKTKFIKSEDPGEFFRANMSSLLETKLNEMFSKLEEIYSNGPASDAPAEEQTDLDNNKDSDLENNKESDAEKDEETDPDKNKETDSEKNIEGDVEIKEGDVEKKEGDVEKKEGDVEKKEGDVEKKETDVEKKKNDVEKKDNDVETQENDVEKKENDVEKKDSVDEKKKEIILLNNTAIDLQKNKEQNNKNKEFTKEYKNFLNSTIKVHDVKRILPKLIKRYVPYIVKLLNLDTTYQSTKAAITMKANEKAANIFGAKGTEQGQGDSATAATPQTTVDQRQIYNLPYYVKIMGRPSLPRRKVMQGFLSQFNPKSIKKHRTIHNLLFVGFNEKSDFDVMVGADGTVVGRSTLSVRICTNQGPRESNGDNNDTSSANDESQIEAKTNDKNDSIISSDLEGQITDLLSSIRKSDEEDSNKENGDGGDNPQTENNTDEVKMEEGEGDVKNDEENAGDEENAANDENETKEDQGEEAEGIESQNTEGSNEADNMEVGNETEKPVTDDSNKEQNSEDSHEGEKSPTKTDEQSDNKVGELKSNATGKSTPSRMSARIANVTPSTIRTRRASRLMPQN